MNYYNEFDKKTAAWLRELIKQGHIPKGEVDERSITEVQPDDLTGFAQCHFFAGIAGWSYALKLAGWPEDRPVWTGSCPCQPFSNAGKGLGEKDPRHLWPEFLRLITKRKPAIIFGEQVASKAGRLWLSGVRANLEALAYAVGAADLCAASVKAPHVRPRLWWVADSTSHGCKRIQPGVVSQVPKDWTSKTLGSWNPTGSPFKDWKKFMAESHVGRMDDGVSSTVDIRPRLRAFGNAIVPQLAAEFIQSYQEATGI